jgi:hypothetical protein
MINHKYRNIRIYLKMKKHGANIEGGSKGRKRRRHRKKI